MIDASEAISYLIGTSGNPKLAAVRATAEKGVTITEAQLLTAVSSDPTSMMMLATQTRILLLLRVIDTLRVTEMAYLESLGSLSAKDTASTYVGLLKSVGQMIATAPAPQQNNTMAAVLAGLPSNVRESVQFLLTATDELVHTDAPQGATPPTPPVKTPPGYLYEQAEQAREEAVVEAAE